MGHQWNDMLHDLDRCKLSQSTKFSHLACEKPSDMTYKGCNSMVTICSQNRHSFLFKKIQHHIIGFATDTAKPARTMLVLMVCPIFGAPAFVARLIPIYSLSAELIYTQVIALIKIIHESSGYVYLVMNDNLAANIKFFRMLHEKFVSVNSYSTNIQFLTMFSEYCSPCTIQFIFLKTSKIFELLKISRNYVFAIHEEMNVDFGHVIAVYQR